MLSVYRLEMGNESELSKQLLSAQQHLGILHLSVLRDLLQGIQC